MDSWVSCTSVGLFSKRQSHKDSQNHFKKTPLIRTKCKFRCILNYMLWFYALQYKRDPAFIHNLKETDTGRRPYKEHINNGTVTTPQQSYVLWNYQKITTFFRKEIYISEKECDSCFFLLFPSRKQNQIRPLVIYNHWSLWLYGERSNRIQPKLGRVFWHMRCILEKLIALKD